MVPFYLGPPFAVMLVAAARSATLAPGSPPPRSATVVATVVSFHQPVGVAVLAGP